MPTIRNALSRSTLSPLLAGSLVCAQALLLGCSPDGGRPYDAAGGASNGGTIGSGGTTGANTGGTVSSGGTSGGSTATGGSSTSGGVAQAGGASSTGGATAGAATGGVTASGGAGDGGKAGSTADGKGGVASTGGVQGNPGGSVGAGGGSAGGGGKAPPNPSTGCGKASPQTGTSGSPLKVSNHQYYVKLPTNYDANKPYPVLIIFNPTNNPITWAEQSAGYEALAKADAIRVYPHPQNSSSGWGSGDVSFFKPLYDQITGAYCIDKARVFAGGESSGGDFSSIIGCEHADLLRAIAPCATKDVPQYPLDTSKRKCTGEVTAIVIHGKNDSVVGTANGPKTRDFYTKLNHCGTMTEPVSGYTSAQSNCVQYQGCDAGFPVYWCQHTDPNYEGTNHGWPAFAAKMTWGVFSSY